MRRDIVYEVKYLIHYIMSSGTGIEFCWVPSHCGLYWAIRAGLLTPLTFARHRLSPLAAFTSGAYFLHNGRR